MSVRTGSKFAANEGVYDFFSLPGDPSARPRVTPTVPAATRRCVSTATVTAPRPSVNSGGAPSQGSPPPRGPCSAPPPAGPKALPGSPMFSRLQRGLCSAPLTELTLRGFPAVGWGAVSVAGPQLFSSAGTRARTQRCLGGRVHQDPGQMDGRTDGSCWPPEPLAVADSECPWAVKPVLSSQLSIFPEL